ncbi:hypothetical protein [Duganella fentianensis]|uniref:hypothetical protein n=1 Tax=Duganella fentianensis TaxID=2692177 RepID=UPI0032B2F42B
MISVSTFKRDYETQQIARAGRSVTGYVTEKSCHNHGRVSYRYVVDGNAYTGTDSASVCGLQDCTHVQEGAEVTVSYAATQPALASCASISQQRSSVRNSYYTMLWFGAALAFSLWRQWRKWRMSLADGAA